MGLSENSSRGIAVIKEKITADPAVIFLVLRKDSVLKMKHEMIGDGRPEVLPGIIGYLLQEDYTFVPISESILKGDHSIDHTGRRNENNLT